MSSRNDVAIIGMACRFPGAPNPRAFWRNIRDGIESIRRIPVEHSPPDFVPFGGVLDGAEEFDAEFFRIIPRHAEMLDPQQRLLLECAWEALESAGYDPEQVPGATGVYLSIARSSYPQSEPRTAVERLVAYASEEKDYAATRISYKLNLKGPSMTVQTASSSSLVAVHMACQSLLHGDCDVAIAGGACLVLPQAGYVYDPGMMFSPDGRCRAFDAAAGGTVPGSGVGLVAVSLA